MKVGTPSARPWRALLAGSCALLATAGCATPSWLCMLPPGPRTLTLLTTPSTNAGAAVTVDLVLVSDAVAAGQITALSAQDYYLQRDQLQRDFPTGFVFRSWGLSPGQVARDLPVHATCNRAATVLFARYASPGDHRQVLVVSKALSVSLGDADFSVDP